jgi:hypothetical protein
MHLASVDESIPFLVQFEVQRVNLATCDRRVTVFKQAFDGDAGLSYRPGNVSLTRSEEYIAVRYAAQYAPDFFLGQLVWRLSRGVVVSVLAGVKISVSTMQPCSKRVDHALIVDTLFTCSPRETDK